MEELPGHGPSMPPPSRQASFTEQSHIQSQSLSPDSHVGPVSTPPGLVHQRSLPQNPVLAPVHTPIQTQAHNPHTPSTIGSSPYSSTGVHTPQVNLSAHSYSGIGLPPQAHLPPQQPQTPQSLAPHNPAVGHPFPPSAHGIPPPLPGQQPPPGVPRPTTNVLFHPVHRSQPAYLSFEVPHHPDLSANKLTRGTSCVLCQQRKVRCDKRKPCANCVKARVECRVVPPLPPRRRKKRMHERDLVERLRKYESLLAEKGVQFDSIEDELKKRGSRPGNGGDEEELADLGDDFEGLKTSPESMADSNYHQRPKKRFNYHREFQASEQLLRDSSDEDDFDGSAIHNAFDEMYGGQEGFPFIVAGRNQPVTHLHPSVMHIMQLWNVYLTNVNPIVRITHVPTVQSLVIEGSANLETLPKNVEALMFCIYLMAITSMDDSETRRLFGQARIEMQAKYYAAAQQALVNTGFMRTNDMLSLTAFVLYLFAIRQIIDPRQIFCLTGIAVRIAQRMGLHRDGANFGFSPFEVEQRRRLWWTLVSYDRRMGEMTGCTITALSFIGDCRLPLNINDSDIHVDGTETPTPHNGPTEMVFSLTWLELAMAIANDSQRDSLTLGRYDKGVAAPPPDERLIRLAHQDDSPVWTIDGFCAHIEGAYLRHCDPKIPFHFFTLTMTRQGLCKMRVISFLMRLVRPPGSNQTLNELERENLFLEAVQMIEYDNVVQSAPSLRNFKWYTYFHFPFPAYMFLFNELKHRTTGPMVERAWDAITENHELRGFANNLHSPMHIAFGNHFVKAWGAHERAMEAIGKSVERPRWLINLKIHLEKRNKAPPTKAGEMPAVGGEASSPSAPARQPLAPQSGARLAPPPKKEESLVMTPPEDGGATGATAGTTPGSDSDMDWGYLLQEYQQGNLANFHMPTIPGQDENGNLYPPGPGGSE